jgi:hypothetical protein
MSADRMLSNNETAIRLGIQPRTLAVWRQRGIGPGYERYDRAIRYKESEVEAYMARHAVPQGRGPKQSLWPRPQMRTNTTEAR